MHKDKRLQLIVYMYSLVMQMAIFSKYDKYAIKGCSQFHEK